MRKLVQLDETPPAVSSDAHERALLRRIGKKDHQALQELYITYHRRLGRFLTRSIRHPESIQEIVNDTLFVVWQQAETFRGESRVSTWIMGIAYRRALKTLRRANLHLQGDQAAADADTTAQYDDHEITEQREWLTQALAALPFEQRVVLEFTYFMGHSCEEIATIMGCPVSTVKTRMFHARRKLKTLLPVLSGARGVHT